jgi:tetratricopeptide (TPR) repeat protein/CHAT domain-containing protein
MVSVSFVRLFARILIATLALLAALPVQAQSAEDIQARNRQVEQLINQGKHAEAFKLAEQTLSLAERVLGPEHPSTLTDVSNLGLLYHMQGRHAEAEPLYKRVFAGREKALGPEHPETLLSVNILGVLYDEQGRYAEAEPFLKRAVEGREATLGPTHPDTLVSVSLLGNFYQARGRYAEAEPLYQRALAGYEKALGPAHPDTLVSINNLGNFYQARGRYAEAEPLLKRTLAGREATLGPEHPETLVSVSNLGVLYREQGRYAEAEPLYRRALVGREAALGPTHLDTLRSANNLGLLYGVQGRYAEAEPLHKQALAGYETALGPAHPDTLKSVNNLGAFYFDVGRYAEAESLFKRALAGSETALGLAHPDTLRSINNLGRLYNEQSRDAEAERLYKRALVGYETTLGPEHPDTLTSVNNLGALYWEQGRYVEAEPLLMRVLTGNEKALGPAHPDTLRSVNNLGQFYSSRGRHAEAEPLFKRALAGYEAALGPAHPETLVSINNLSVLYQAQGRYAEAEPLYKRALAGYEVALGLAHPDTLISVNNLGFLYDAQGRYAEAQPLYERALAGREKALGPEHPATLMSVNNLAALQFAQRDWQGAAQLWRRSTTAIAARTERGLRTADQTLVGKKKSAAEQSAGQFRGLVRTVYRLAPEGRVPDAREMFETAQWALSSEAAQALAQMVARGASGNPALAASVRERQDLVAEWQQRELLQSAAFGQQPGNRNARAEAENSARMTAIGKRIDEIDTELSAEFPDFAALASPAPLSMEQVQAQLGADEALVLFLDTSERKPTPEETFIWLVTKTDMRWIRSDLGKTALAREVQTLRCGLDAENWATAGNARHCVDLLGLHDLPDPSQPLPFDLRRAHALYKALLGPAEDLLKGKNLVIVPSGALTQLPFQVLVTAPPTDHGDFKSAAWLVRDHAVSVLPAVSSLKALRHVGRPGTADRPLIGFANPLLDGPDSRYAVLAKRAREKQSCAKTALQRIAAVLGLQRSLTPLDIRSELADVSLIRRQAPLPETADELCAVAYDLGADVKQLRLGAQATEHQVKELSKSGELAHYRILHFATHGAMAGQLSLTSEPGLILTPPEKASESDDGYLSASEVAGLKLDADWVILSACNTAAGEAANAEALSGLARAFIYAGTRALLVSHWAVDTNATVKLITTAMREIAKGKSVARAEALRQAMLSLIDSHDRQEAHPAYWAPFVVVGEGAR